MAYSNLIVTLSGEFMGVATNDYTDKQGVEKSFPYLKILDFQDNLTRVSCNEAVAKEASSRFKRSQSISLDVKVYARNDQANLAFVKFNPAKTVIM